MTMRAGNYYIGDLCYVLHDEWNEVCELIFNTPDPMGILDGEFNLKDGRRFAIYSTAYGDGYYETNCGANLGVDAGSIGCILVDDIDVMNNQNNISLGNIVEFKENFETSGGRFDNKDWDGVIRFGWVEVKTAYEEEEDDIA